MKEDSMNKYTPPCPCHYCNDWIDEYDFYRIDILGRSMCLECYAWLQQDRFDAPEDTNIPTIY